MLESRQGTGREIGQGHGMLRIQHLPAEHAITVKAGQVISIVEQKYM